MKALINIILIGIIFCFLGCSNKAGHEGPTGYEGEKLDGKYHGQGTMTWSNGDKYEGEWKDGKLHGQGTLTWYDGWKHVGEWKDGKEHGQGSTSNADGFVTLEGTFKEGKIWDGKETCPVGGHLADFKDGEKLVVSN